MKCIQKHGITPKTSIDSLAGFIEWMSMINESNEGVSVSECQRLNSWIIQRRTTAKAFTKNVFVDQERKLRDRRGLDTLLVLTINYII